MKIRILWIAFMLFAQLLLAGCSSKLRVGALQNETQSVELGDAKSVKVEIEFGAGKLEVTGGAEKLLEGDFTYNVAKLKPEVKYTDGTLVVKQPEVKGLPVITGITEYRNEWSLRLNNAVPIDLKVQMGAGNGNLQLSSLSLTGLDVELGAGISTVDLSGDWEHDLDATFDTGAAEITVRLPKDVGVRVEIDAGPTAINASGLTKDGNVYTNDAYGVSDVTLQIKMEAGIGQITLEEEDQTQEAFIIAYNKLNAFRGGSLAGWLLVIVTNLCLDELRRRKRRCILRLEPVDGYGGEIESPRWLREIAESPEEATERSYVCAALQAGINRLPPEYRCALVLVDIQGLDYAKAAEVIGCPIGTVKSLLARARWFLRVDLNEKFKLA